MDETGKDKMSSNYQENQVVDLLIENKSDLGFNAIINGRDVGVLYQNEIFRSLEPGQRLSGFIKKIRPDGKIDLSLQLAQVRKQDTKDLSEKILDLLKQKGGFLPVHTKTSAENIYNLFGVSKKKYKIALGGLYKKRIIHIEETGIHLVD